MTTFNLINSWFVYELAGSCFRAVTAVVLQNKKWQEHSYRRDVSGEDTSDFIQNVFGFHKLNYEWWQVARNSIEWYQTNHVRKEARNVDVVMIRMEAQCTFK